MHKSLFRCITTARGGFWRIITVKGSSFWNYIPHIFHVILKQINKNSNEKKHFHKSYVHFSVIHNFFIS